MKQYIKDLTFSQLMTAIYLIIVLVGLPLIVHKAYANIGEAKYYFYCGASILLVPVLVLDLKSTQSIKTFFRTLSTADKALIVYWVVSALSTLFSPYRFEAFWGNEGRYCGLFLITIYMLMYFLISRHYKPHPIFIYACLFAGCIVFILGITDFFNLNLLHFKDNIMEEYANIFMSTIGNINFYTGYGAIIVGLIAGLYTTTERTINSILYFFVMILCFIGLIIGNSDNIYLTFGVLLAILPFYLFRKRVGLRRYFMMISALLLSFLIVKLFCIYFNDIVLDLDGVSLILTKWDGFFLLCISFWIITGLIYGNDYILHKPAENPGNKAQIIWGIILIILAIIGIAILVDANLLGHAQRYGVIKNYVIFDKDWGTHRGFAWYKAIEKYKNFPLLQKIFGHGPDTYGIISYFEDLSESSRLYGELFDSVHNEYLQFLVTIGPIGTMAYIIFLICSIWDMLHMNINPYTVGAAFGVFCYCAQAVVSINQPITTPIMWTLLAMGIGECRQRRIV